jgi:hypothetical protein
LQDCFDIQKKETCSVWRGDRYIIPPHVEFDVFDTLRQTCNRRLPVQGFVPEVLPRLLDSCRATVFNMPHPAQIQKTVRRQRHKAQITERRFMLASRTTYCRATRQGRGSRSLNRACFQIRLSGGKGFLRSLSRGLIIWDSVNFSV